MRESILRSYIRYILESSDKDDDDEKHIDNLLLEPKADEESRKRESSTVGGGAMSGGLLSEPDGAMSADVGDASDSMGFDGEVDSGDGCSEIEDCERENKEEVDEASGAGAVAGAITPLGAGPTYPAPDRRSPSRARRETARAVGRAFGGASPKK